MTVFVAYLPSPEGKRALEAGAAEARLRGLPLHVASVLTHEVGESPTRARADMEASEATEQHLERVAEELRREGVEVSVELLHGQFGEVSHQLLDDIRRVGAELVVVGVRRRSPVGKLVLGSASRDVLLGAGCPVLAVKADQET
jgi:nucleotide-binding universal stress UspA family protein